VSDMDARLIRLRMIASFSQRRSEDLYTMGGVAIKRIKRVTIGLMPRVSRLLLGLLVLLALVVPTIWVGVKALLLSMALMAVVASGSQGRLKYSTETLLACTVFALVGSLYSLLGLLRDAPGAIRVLSVYAVWPVVYGLLSPILATQNLLDGLRRCLTIATLLVGLHSLLVVAAGHGWISEGLVPSIEQGAGYGQYEGYSEFNLWSLASMLFLTPWGMHRLLMTPHEGGLPRLMLMLLIVLLTLLVVLVSGRRALVLVVAVTPIVALCSEVLLGRSLQLVFEWSRLGRLLLAVTLLVAAVAVTWMLLDVSLAAVWQQMVFGFDFFGDSEGSASARGDQLSALLDGWLNSGVLFGAGNGSAVELKRGGVDQPWAYELSYVYLLFSTGLVGVVFYLLWFGWGLARLRRICRSRPELCVETAPVLTGVLCFLIGNASNPYLAKFDYLWIAFLPHLLAGALSSTRIRRSASGVPHPVCQMG